MPPELTLVILDECVALNGIAWWDRKSQNGEIGLCHRSASLIGGSEIRQETFHSTFPLPWMALGGSSEVIAGRGRIGKGRNSPDAQTGKGIALSRTRANSGAAQMYLACTFT